MARGRIPVMMAILCTRPQTQPGATQEAGQKHTRLTEPEGERLCSWRSRKSKLSALPLEEEVRETGNYELTNIILVNQRNIK